MGHDIIYSFVWNSKHILNLKLKSVYKKLKANIHDIKLKLQLKEIITQNHNQTDAQNNDH